jgi:hypothetical protein
MVCNQKFQKYQAVVFLRTMIKPASRRSHPMSWIADRQYRRRVDEERSEQCGGSDVPNPPQ